MQDAVRGQLRVRVWPDPAKKRKTQQQKDLEYAFREANKTAKQWPPDQQVDYREAVAGTALLPRDLILMTIYGNALAIKMQDGKVLYSMVSRAKVSESLDILSQQPGSILARGEVYWSEIPPGHEGQILVMGADGIPYWSDVDSGIIIGSATIPANENTGSGAYVDLATVGPTVTIATGTDVLITLGAGIYKNTGGAGCNGWMAVDVSGATTIAPVDGNGWTWSAFVGGGFADQCERTFKLGGLTPGVNTFKAKYKVNCGNFNWFNRSLTVRAL